MHPGGMLSLRVALKGPDGSKWMTQQVRVPGNAKGEGRLSVTGGAWTWNEGLWSADTLAEVKKALASDTRNDEVETRLDFWRGRDDVRKRVASDPQALVVEGRKSASVIVRR